MYDKIIILDFGSQTTQLIARRLRELKEYCEILPYNKFPAGDTAVKGVILSGSPFSVHDKEAFSVDLSAVRGKIPMLGICYGAQFLAHTSGGKVEPAGSRQSGNAIFDFIDGNDLLFKGIEQGSQVRMSLSDKITALPANAKKTAGASGETAAYKIDGEKTWGIQFQPEVYETADGMKILSNFLDICGASRTWSPASFIENTVRELKEKIGNDKVILALSGGVDSSVTAVLLHRAIGENFTCVFVDHGLLRKNEFENVLRDYRHLGLNVIGIDARKRFYGKLAGITDPEQKRKIIGASFIDVFDEEAKKIKDVKWLAQGTIYPDIIESLSITGVTVKSHHNVGGLPEKMNLKLIEPLRLLFKDEVRKVGTELGMQPHLINRHPFPGPGLGVRLLGDITEEKIHILQDADDIFISALREWSLYDKVWQAGAILLPIQSVGMMDDKRTYENAVALRAVNSTDAMTADWATLPFDFLAHVSNSIITKVRGVNRVVYDISSKPPATIEWE